MVDLRSDTLVVLPVPRQGELYVRYGSPSVASTFVPPPDLTDAEALRRLIREELVRLSPAARRAPTPADVPAGQGAISEVQMELLERRIAEWVTEAVAERLVARLDAVVAHRVQEEGELLRRVLRDQIARSLTSAELPDVRRASAADLVGVRVRQNPFTPTAVIGYTGAVVEPTQVLLGARVDLGPIDP